MACAAYIVKYLVFLFNLLCALAGLGFIAVGVLYKINYEEITSFLPENDIAPILLITLGAVIFVISFFGCCGAVRESTCMLTTYAVMLLVLFILQIALGVYAFLQYKDNKTEFKATFKSSLETIFKDYNSEKSKVLVDSIQNLYQCCGVDSYLDWNKWNDGVIVSSCCSAERCDTSNVYQTGCYKAVWDYTQKSAEKIGIIVLVIGAVELLGAIVALCLANSIRNKERRGYY